MKIGLRTPSIKKSIKARTTGKVKRKLKSSLNPLYGKKGMGLVNDPKKAIYNKVYSKTTISAIDAISNVGTSETKNAKPSSIKTTNKKSSIVKTYDDSTLRNNIKYSIFIIFLFGILAVFGIIGESMPLAIIAICIALLFIYLRIVSKKELESREK